MTLTVRYKLFILFALSLTAGLYFLPSAVETQAQEECEKSLVVVIARNSYGEFIPNIPFEFYTQTVDVDGNPKPCTKVASGKIDANLGKDEVEFKGDNKMHVIRTWDKNSNTGAFWFYDALQVGCGEILEKTLYLSGIRFVLRDTEGNLRKNKQFSVYTQRYDVDGNPIKEKQDFVAKLNTSEEGEVILYVADRSRSKDGKGADHYIFETSGQNGGTYVMYDIKVDDTDTTEIEYVFSDMKIVLEDADGVLFPANTKIEIFRQSYDVDDERVLGDKIKDIYTDDKGIAILEYPAGVFAARIKGADAQYQIFWDLEIVDQKRKTYKLTTDTTWDPGKSACEADSTITVITRGLDGNFIPGLHFVIYEQTVDMDGIPAIGPKFINGAIDQYGQGIVVANPDPRKKYALKIYDKNANIGDFWFYDEIQFVCGADRELVKKLPAINVILRDGSGNLKKKHKFSLYTQKYDIDGKRIKQKNALVSSKLATSEQGMATIYVAPDHSYNNSKCGTYMFTTIGANKAEFVEYDIIVSKYKDILFEYQLSDIILEIKNANNQPLKGKNIEFYKQEKNLKGQRILGKHFKSIKTDSNGEARLEYPAGYYAAVVKDDVGKNNIFWNTQIKNRQSVYKTLTVNLTRIKVYDAKGKSKPEGTVIAIYAMDKDEKGEFYKGQKLKSFVLSSSGYADAVLAPSPYLVTVVSEKIEYGQALYTENSKLQEIDIHINSNYELSPGQKFQLVKPESVQSLAEKLKGYILLQVEDHGQAWYVDMETRQRYYMKDGGTAYEMMRQFGLGITSADLNKIPIGLDDRLAEHDEDADGVHDKMEEALGTDIYNSDSDGDGHDDGTEIRHGYNPLGSGKLPHDTNFAEKLKGRILLQVESRGQAWYVNPKDGKCYYMKDGESAYEIMRFLSLGITNENLEKIEDGVINATN